MATHRTWRARREFVFASVLLLSGGGPSPVSAQRDFKGERPAARAGEGVRRTPMPPVNEAAAARAERAPRSRPASISDQVELAIRRGNFSVAGIAGDSVDTPEERKLAAQAEAYYGQALKLSPKDWRALAGLGEVYRKKGQYGDSVASYERAAALRPRDPFIQTALGWAYSDDRKHAEAIRAFSRSIELDPSAENESAYYFLAKEYRRAGLIDEAIRTYRRLLSVAPMWSWYNSIGELLFEQKKYDEALDVYRKGTELYPDARDAREILADLYMFQNRYGEAAETYRTYLRLFPQSNNDRNRNLYKLGEALLELRDIQSARDVHKELAGLNPGRAKELLELMNLVAAIESARDVLRANPNDAAAHFNIGSAYALWEHRYSRYAGLKNHYAEAIESLKDAVRLKPDFPEARFNLGLVYRLAGDKSAAMEQYGALKQLKPELAEELLKAINR